MDTYTSSQPRTRRPRVREIVAEALIGVGFVLMTLGILEIGGLFNVGVGFATIWVGCVLLFLGGGGDDDGEDGFPRIRGDR